MASKSAKPRRPAGDDTKAPPSDPAAGSASTPVRPEQLTQEIDALPNLYSEDMEGSTNTDQTAVLQPTSLRTAQRATLMVLSGGQAGKVFPIEHDRFIVGRGKDANLILHDTGISRTHCAVVRQNARYYIEDLGSTNGTLVNGGRVERAELQAGDRFQIGAEAVLQFGFFDAAEEGLVNQLYESATRDPLTRALNRRAFQDRLLAEVSYAVRHHERLVGILLDIDRFKTVNDTWGHTAGDLVLRGVATAIATTLRTEDVFARYGGEEFVLLGRGLTLENGVKLAERIRLLVESTEFTLPKDRLKVTLSAGVAVLEETDATGDELLAVADRRLYEAKRSGRNRVVSAG